MGLLLNCDLLFFGGLCCCRFVSLLTCCSSGNGGVPVYLVCVWYLVLIVWSLWFSCAYGAVFRFGYGVCLWLLELFDLFVCVAAVGLLPGWLICFVDSGWIWLVVCCLATVVCFGWFVCFGFLDWCYCLLIVL